MAGWWSREDHFGDCVVRVSHVSLIDYIAFFALGVPPLDAITRLPPPIGMRRRAYRALRSIHARRASARSVTIGSIVSTLPPAFNLCRGLSLELPQWVSVETCDQLQLNDAVRVFSNSKH